MVFHSLTLEDEATHYRAPVQLSIYVILFFGPFFAIDFPCGTFYWKAWSSGFNVGVVNFILFC